MNISEKQLRELLISAWELAAAAEREGINEPTWQEAEIDGLIDVVEEEEEEEPVICTTQGALFDEMDCGISRFGLPPWQDFITK